MKNLTEIIIIICEGKSEVAYLQLLNQFLRERECSLSFVPIDAGGGICKTIVRKYDEEKERNKRSRIVAWVDDDLYSGDRNGADKICSQQFKSLSPNLKKIFKFSKHNFEDFLALHKDNEKFEIWKNVCKKHNHFSVPMTESEYMPLVRKHLFPDYRKGDCPFEELTEEMLGNLFRHNQEPFESSFANFLRQVLNDARILP